VVGIALAVALMSAWAGLHVYSVFFHPLARGVPLITGAMVALICWLNVGLFIIAHDAMHGSLAPGRPQVNRFFGRLALRLYAGFAFDRLRARHFEHHRWPGSEQDPDFSTGKPGFWRWYALFFSRYFGVREFAVLFGITVTYLAIGARLPNLLLFWALPAILSSVQLFYFGTFLPHRRGAHEFADHHRARSNGFGWFASLLSCYHFGYHHEHHLAPQVPWWGLPGERRRRASDRQQLGVQSSGGAG
jgi:beta-carotene ketolase (CrtW type)